MNTSSSDELHITANVISETDITSNNSNKSSKATDKLIAMLTELLGPNWLSDDTIWQYLNILNNTVISKNSGITLMNPIICQAIKMLDDYKFILDPINLQNTNYILMPVSDCVDVGCSVGNTGGSHWSLLLYEKLTGGFYHYDSIKGHNYGNALRTASKISDYFTSSTNVDQLFVEANTPQQINSYDCGIYVILLAELAIEQLNTKTFNGPDLGKAFPTMNKLNTTTKRSKIAYIINNQTSVTADFVRLSYQQQFCTEMTHLTSNKTKSDHINVKSKNENRRWEEVKGTSKHVIGDKMASTAVACVRNEESIPLSNKFEVLDGIEQETRYSKEVHFNNRKYNIKKRKQRRTLITTLTSKIKEKEEYGQTMNVEFYSDSHGRGLPEIIGACSKGGIRVSGLVMPGATTQQVYRQAERALHHPLVIIAGTNNILKKSTKEIYSDLEKNLQSLSKKRNVHITTIPNHSDAYPINHTNDEISIANNYIKEVAERINKVNIIDLDQLKRYHFTRHGLHLNYRGKKKLSYMIINSLNKNTTCSKENLPHYNITPGLENPEDSNEIVVNGNFKIIESNMKNIISKNKDKEQLALAHCISRDFNHDRNMSAGVATVFRKQFGKPTTLLTDYLTHQKCVNGVNVYGLVTKSNFYNKPTISDYDTAFKHFIEDFKRRSLKHLICSPMGCIRDNISTQHFAANIIDFQKRTGASVQIIVFNENSRRPLRNGLSFVDFKHNLHAAISSLVLKQTEKNSTLETLEASTANLYNEGTMTGQVTPQETDMIVTASLNDFPPSSTVNLPNTILNTDFSFSSCKTVDNSLSKAEDVIFLKQNNDERPNAMPLNSLIGQTLNPP